MAEIYRICREHFCLLFQGFKSETLAGIFRYKCMLLDVLFEMVSVGGVK